MECHAYVLRGFVDLLIDDLSALFSAAATWTVFILAKIQSIQCNILTWNCPCLAAFSVLNWLVELFLFKEFLILSQPFLKTFEIWQIEKGIFHSAEFLHQ